MFIDIVKFSHLYASQLNNHSFRVDITEIKSFVGILILSGYLKLPRQNMYWENAMDSGIDIVKNAMSYKRYKEIKRYIHLNDNFKLNKEDKVAKLRPMIDRLNKNFKKYGFFDKTISIDEQMVPYYGLHSAKVFIKSKPVRFVYKLWVMVSKTGYIYSFKVYTGKGEIQNNELGLGATVVLNFVKEIPEKRTFTYFLIIFFLHIRFLKH